MPSDLNTPLGTGSTPVRSGSSVTHGHGRMRPILSLLAAVIIVATSFRVALMPDPLLQEGMRPDGESAVSVPAPEREPSQGAQESIQTENRSGAQQQRVARTDAGAQTQRIARQGDDHGRSSIAGPGPRSERGQPARLAHLPVPELVENTRHGPLPVRGLDNRRPMDAYARPWSGARGARVAIVVGGLGLSQTGTQEALRKLPAEITLAFAASGNSLGRWVQTARRAGHEVLLQVPMEPFDYPDIDPGPGTLTTAMPADTALETLHRAMGRMTNYTGIVNFMGGRFMATTQSFDPFLRELTNRGLLFLDDGSSAQSLTDRLAGELGVAYAAGDLRLDARVQRGTILERLDDLERLARRNGSAIGIASAFSESVEAIAAWSNEAKARGIEIVGVSALVDDPERQ